MSGLPETLEPELVNYIRQFEEAKTVARALVDDLNEKQLAWRAKPDRWSIAECLSHLNVSIDRYLPVLDEALEQGREKGVTGRSPFRHGFIVNQIIRSMEPPPTWRASAPALLRPRPNPPAEQMLPRFLQGQDALIQRVRAANGLHLARIRITSPASRFFKMSLGQCYGLLAAHQRRHLWQARGVRDTDGFPGSEGEGGVEAAGS
jgi:hypothetical protein